MTGASVGMTFLFIQEAFIKHWLRIAHNPKETGESSGVSLGELPDVGQMTCVEGGGTTRGECPHVSTEENSQGAVPASPS